MYDTLSAAPNVPETEDPKSDILEKYRKLEQQCDEIIQKNKSKKLTLVK
jgi:hypothetical protein